jgi:hypothetical protein
VLTLSHCLLDSFNCRRVLPGRRIYCSDPTWENHGRVVADAGLGELLSYRYWNAASKGLDFEGFCTDLRSMPEGSIVLLHACAHNPTGVDPDHAQWAAIADVIADRKLVPWFDMAYQGFATGDLDADAWAVRHFTERGMNMCVFSRQRHISLVFEFGCDVRFADYLAGLSTKASRRILGSTVSELGLYTWLHRTQRRRWRCFRSLKI